MFSPPARECEQRCDPQSAARTHHMLVAHMPVNQDLLLAFVLLASLLLLHLLLESPCLAVCRREYFVKPLCAQQHSN